MRNLPVVVAAACLLAALATPQAALAWPNYEKDFKAHVSLEQEYTDNLQLMTVQGEEDFITSIRPGFTAAAISQESGFKLDYDLGFSHYWELNDQFMQHSARATAWQQLEFLRFDATGSFLYQEFPIEVSDVGDVVGLRDVVSPYYRADASPGVSWVFGDERSLRAGYNYIKYWSESSRFQDSELSAPNVALTYALDHSNLLEATYQYEKGTFSRGVVTDTSDYTGNRVGGAYTRRVNPHLEATASYNFADLDFTSGTAYQTHQGTVGVHWLPAQNTTLTLMAGYFFVDQKGQDQSGPVLDAEVTQKFEGGQVSLAGNWGFAEDYFTSENLGVYEYKGVRLSGSYQLTERLTANASGAYREMDYSQAGRNDTYWNAGAGLSWLLRPWLSAQAVYSHYKYNSTAGPGFTGIIWDFGVNSYLLSLTATYD